MTNVDLKALDQEASRQFDELFQSQEDYIKSSNEFVKELNPPLVRYVSKTDITVDDIADDNVEMEEKTPSQFDFDDDFHVFSPSRKECPEKETFERCDSTNYVTKEDVFDFSEDRADIVEFSTQQILENTHKPEKCSPHNEIREMRQKHLSHKSLSILLVDSMLQRRSDQLAVIERQAGCLPTIKNMSRMKSKQKGALKLVNPEDIEFINIPTQLERVVSYLLEGGADPSYTDADGIFPLLMAVQYRNSFRLVRMLIRAGADVNQTWNGLSMVDISWKLRRTDICIELLEQGGIPTSESSRDKDGVTFLGFAKQNGFHALASESLKRSLWDGIESLNIQWVDSTLKHGISPNVLDSNMRTPLYTLVERGCKTAEKDYLPIVKLLLTFGADVNHLDTSNTPMLCYPLIRSGKPSKLLIDMLLKFGADPSVHVESTNETLIQFAREHAFCKSHVETLEKIYAEKMKQKRRHKERLKEKRHSESKKQRIKRSRYRSVI